MSRKTANAEPRELTFTGSFTLDATCSAPEGDADVGKPRNRRFTMVAYSQPLSAFSLALV